MQVSKPKKGYKFVDAGFGKLDEIPEEWESKELKDISLLSGGFAFKSEDYSKKGRFILRTMNILENGSISKENSVFIPEEASNKYQKFELCENDTLFVMVGATLGKVGYVTSDVLPALLNQNMWLIRAKSVNPLFLNYLFKIKSNQFIKKSGGTARSFALRSDFKKLIFNIPPIYEQNKITLILSNIDNTLEKTYQIIQKTELLKKGLMQKLFTKGIGHTKFKKSEIGRIPEIWKVSTIDNEFVTGSGGTPKRVQKEFYNGTIPWVKTTEVNYNLITITEENISELGLENSSAKKYPAGTLLIAMYGQGKTRGRCAILGIDAATNQACAALQKKKEANTKFIYYFLENSYEKIRIGQGSGQPNLTLELVKKIKIPIPPIDEQKQIVSIISNVNSQITKEKLQKSNLEILKKGLMQKLLTGKIRVKF